MVSTRVRWQETPSEAVKEALRAGLVVRGYLLTSPVGPDGRISVLLCGSGREVTGEDPCW